MSYLGKVKRQRNFKVDGYVVQLDPKGFFGIRKVGCRSGLVWYSLDRLCNELPDNRSGQFIDPVLAHVDKLPLDGGIIA